MAHALHPRSRHRPRPSRRRHARAPLRRAAPAVCTTPPPIPTAAIGDPVERPDRRLRAGLRASASISARRARRSSARSSCASASRTPPASITSRCWSRHTATPRTGDRKWTPAKSSAAAARWPSAPKSPASSRARTARPPCRRRSRLVRAWMEEAGLTVRIDAVGNVRGVRGRRAAPDDRLPHRHRAARRRVRRRARRDARDRACAATASKWSPSSRKRSRSSAAASLELDDSVAAYLEFHIEQGPVLDSLGLPLGVVEAIVGQRRFDVRFTGRAGHAGTTPMHLRRDALAAAAEWIGHVERVARRPKDWSPRSDGSKRAGRRERDRRRGPRMTLDVRHARDEIRAGAVRAHLCDLARAAASTSNGRRHMDQPAVALHPRPVARAVERPAIPCIACPAAPATTP